MHLFAMVVWLGGLMYQVAVTISVAKVEGLETSPATLHQLRRFIPFVWMSVWTMLVTGIVLMLFNPKFMFLQFNDGWSVLLALKQAVYVMMVVYSFGYVRMFRRLDDVTDAGEGMNKSAISYYDRLLQFGRMIVALGIAGLLLAAGMQ